MIDASDAVARLARPEYTGANRCLPCTVANVTIAVVIAVVIAVAISGAAGALTLGAFLAIIYLRGYLVPGTPTFTRRYLPEQVLAGLGKTSGREITLETADFDAAVNALWTADVVTRRADGLRLTPEFRERWRERLEHESGDTALPDAAVVATMFDADEIDFRGDATVEIDASRLVRWPSDTALAVDVAADRELRTELDGWTELDPDDRRDLLTGLRLLWDRCPACSGRLATHVDRLEHCCRRPRVAVESACEECGRSIASLAVLESSPILKWISERDAADA